jgi:hypothetical protein
VENKCLLRIIIATAKIQERGGDDVLRADH